LGNITKQFPGVTALDDVSFEVQEGHCHALVGENGAGKSTLGKIIAGIYQPDGGSIVLNGRPVHYRSPAAAAGEAVSVVHQELAFCPNLSVAENLFLGDLPSHRGRVQWGEVERGARSRLKSVGLEIDPWMPINELSTAQEQLVQIAAAIGLDARIVIMDEPTSSLSTIESERLFRLIDGLRSRGVTIIYVSHHLHEIMRLADRVTVLRDGRHVATKDIGELSPTEIVRLMIGRNIDDVFPAAPSAPGATLLEVRRLSVTDRFDAIDLTIRAGEIVGLAGLVGAGRSELARTIFGIDRIDSGEIRMESRPVAFSEPAAAIRHGIGLVPEDRKRQGLVLSMGCMKNVSLASLDRVSRGPWLSGAAERRLSDEFIAPLGVPADVHETVANLSGGNQQKIVLAKWLARHCKLLILDEPTRGIDIAAKAEIHRLVLDLAARGCGVLLISSEMPELLSLSTRICVMATGRIVGELPRAQATEERLMRLMAGLSPE
ncbi:MAG TPA: sugar ABC transporter ATP-binding protein, partial [Phycisphaerae bacterium]|nr:sugar ABC transporter ATP-binding protein [Phycisphaerae bacterium]